MSKNNFMNSESTKQIRDEETPAQTINGNKCHLFLQTIMERNKYRTHIAQVAWRKTSSVYVYSRETHTFVHREPVLRSYNPIPAKVMEHKNTNSSLFGKGSEGFRIDGGVIVEAYQAPGFSSHILIPCFPICVKYFNPRPSVQKMIASFSIKDS